MAKTPKQPRQTSTSDFTPEQVANNPALKKAYEEALAEEAKLAAEKKAAAAERRKELKSQRDAEKKAAKEEQATTAKKQESSAKEDVEESNVKKEKKSSLSKVIKKISDGSKDSTLGNIAGAVTKSIKNASVGAIPNLRGVAAATLDAAGVGGVMGLIGGGGGGAKTKKNGKSEGGGSDTLESILNVTKDNGEILTDILAAITGQRRDQIEAAREANRKVGGPNVGAGEKEGAPDSGLNTKWLKWVYSIGFSLGAIAGILTGYVSKWIEFGKFVGELMGKALRGIKSLFSGSGLAGRIGKVFETISETVSEFLKPIVNVGKYLANTFSKITSFIGEIIKPFKVVLQVIGDLFKATGFFGETAGLVSKSFGAFAKGFKLAFKGLPILGEILMIIEGVWDTIEGAIEGYKNGGLEGAISGAMKGFFGKFIGGFGDLIKDITSWVLKKLGFNNAAAFLDSFSFEDIANQMVDQLIAAIKYPFIWLKDNVPKMLDSLKTWWDSWTVTDVITTAFNDFKTKVGKLLDPVIEWWNSWTLSNVITTAFDDFKTKIINYFGPDFIKQINDVLSFDIGGYIGKKLSEAIDKIKNLFGDLSNSIGAWVGDKIDSVNKILPEFAQIPNPFKSNNQSNATSADDNRAAPKTKATSSFNSMAAAGPAMPLVANQEPSYDGMGNFTGYTDTTTSSAIDLSKIVPAENATAPAFVQKSNDSAVDRVNRAPPIVINQTPQKTPQPVSGRGGSRASRGTVSTAPVVSHLEKAMTPNVGVYP